jgi:hypothetical protein
MRFIQTSHARQRDPNTEEGEEDLSEMEQEMLQDELQAVGETGEEDDEESSYETTEGVEEEAQGDQAQQQQQPPPPGGQGGQQQ